MNLEDLRSLVWRKFNDELRDRLADLRRQNDSPSNDEIQTAVIRGRIAEVKRILSLDASSESPEVGSE